MAHTRFAQIDESLLDTLFHALQKHQHIALLGPRQGAKALILERIEERANALREPDRPLVRRLIWNWFSADEQPQAKDEEVWFLNELQRLLDVKVSFPPGRRLSGKIEDAMIASLTAQPVSRPVWIFVQDILGFSRPIARQMLEALQAINGNRSYRDRLGALVTGSADFIPLTYGPNSPMIRADKYVLQGMSQPFAYHYFCERRKRNRKVELHQENAPTDDAPHDETDDTEEIEPDAFALLYEQTQGNPHLLQELIVGTARHPFHSREVSLRRPWKRGAVEDYILHYINTFLPFDFYLRTTLREIEVEPDLIDILQATLAAPGSVLIDGVQPSPLEVSGFLKRNPQNCLEFSSPIIEQFLRRRLSHRHIADVYASQGRWKNGEVWKQYEGTASALCDRPASGPSRFRWREAVTYWQQYLMSQDHQTRQEVVEHFLHGMHTLFGFEQGGLYLPDEPGAPRAFQSEGGLLPPKTAPPEAASHAALSNENTLASADRLSYKSFPGDLAPPAAKPRYALYLKREGAGREIDHMEFLTLQEVSTQFWKAFFAAQEKEETRQLRQLYGQMVVMVRKLYAATIQEFQNGVFDTSCLVEAVVKALTDVDDYYRVVLCLVNASGTRIQAVTGSCKDEAQAFRAAETLNFALSLDSEPRRTEPDSAGHLYVRTICEKQPMTLATPQTPPPDAPRFDSDMAKRYAMRAVVAVPMMVGDTVIGLCHFERGDGQVPGAGEIGILQNFCNHIGFILKMGQRVEILQSVLNAVDDPIRIVAPDKTVMFVNRSLAKAANYETGWQNAHAKYEPAQIYRWAEASIYETPLDDVHNFQEPIHLYLTSKEGKHQACDLQWALLRDFRGVEQGAFAADGLLGMVEMVHDLTGPYELLRQQENWLRGGSMRHAAEQIARTFGEQGCAWVFLYIYEADEGGEALVSYTLHGVRDESVQQRFRQGDYKIRGKDALAWFPVEYAQKPAIYKRDPAVSPNAPYKLEQDGRGFPCYRVPAPVQLAHLILTDETKQEITQWIEAPLLIGERIIGLMSLAFPDRGLRAAQWERLNLAVYNASIVLRYTQMIDQST